MLKHRRGMMKGVAAEVRCGLSRIGLDVWTISLRLSHVTCGVLFSIASDLINILIIPSAVAALRHDRFFDYLIIKLEVRHEKNHCMYSYRCSFTHTLRLTFLLQLKR